MGGTHKLRWTEPLSGEILLRATVDRGASDEILQKVFDKQYAGISAMYGKEVADTLKWDKGHGPQK